MRICVIDGQGGGIGSVIIKHLKDAFGESIEIIALGTNAIAATQMLKARANRGASGENAIVRTVVDVDIIIGPIGIVLANSMMGEITSKMAEAIASCAARKFLLPLTQEPVEIVGTTPAPLPHLMDLLIKERLKRLMKERGECVKQTHI
ncbi:MAG: DUF3842 family protein [Pseudomonadota bacterium]